MQKIVIDVGHAKDTGAQSWSGVKEHDVCAKIASWIKSYLDADCDEYYGEIVDFPYESNENDLKLTVEKANSLRPVLGISLHADWSENRKAKGAHVCYYSNAGKRIAEAIAEPLTRLIQGRSKKVVKRNNLYILKKTNAPWVLIEVGFLTNEKDLRLMIDQPQVIARVIATAIKKYLAEQK